MNRRKNRRSENVLEAHFRSSNESKILKGFTKSQIEGLDIRYSLL